MELKFTSLFCNLYYKKLKKHIYLYSIYLYFDSKLIFFIKTFEVSRVIRELALLKLLIQNISLLSIKTNKTNKTNKANKTKIFKLKISYNSSVVLYIRKVI